MNYIKSWSRDYGVLYCDIIMRSIGKDSNLLSNHISDSFFYPEQGNESFYVNENQLNKVMKELFLWNNNFEKKLDDFHKIGEEYLSLAKNLSKDNFFDFVKLWADFTVYVWWGFYAGEQYVIQLRKKLEDEIGENISSYLVPSKKSSILKLNEEIERINEFNSEIVETLWENYKWIPCLDLHNIPWTKEQVREYCFSYKKVVIKQKIINFTSKQKKVIKKIQDLIYVRDKRDEYRRRATYHLRLFLDSIGLLSPEDYSYCLSHEVFNPPEKDEIDKRKKGFCLLNDGKISIVEKNVLSDKIPSMSFEKEVIGIVASKGKVQGKVKIILSKNDLVKVENGDVFVAITTHPDYVPAMKKAAAIITDEGGITCHAAIISREFNIPCVVGTGNATLVFKDGDYIEVDADNGVVRRI